MAACHSELCEVTLEIPGFLKERNIHFSKSRISKQTKKATLESDLKLHSSLWLFIVVLFLHSKITNEQSRNHGYDRKGFLY